VSDYSWWMNPDAEMSRPPPVTILRVPVKRDPYVELGKPYPFYLRIRELRAVHYVERRPGMQDRHFWRWEP